MTHPKAFTPTTAKINIAINDRRINNLPFFLICIKFFREAHRSIASRSIEYSTSNDFAIFVNKTPFATFFKLNGQILHCDEIPF